MSYLIYNKQTTYILVTPSQSSGCYVESYKTESAAKAALTRLDKKNRLGSSFKNEEIRYPNGVMGINRVETPYIKADFSIAEAAEFRQNIEVQVTKKNLLSGKEFTQPINTHLCCDPSSETYHCM